MVTIAPRIRPPLLEAIVRLDDRRRPIAETYRQVGVEADRLGLTRPSYQRVRVLVHEVRNMRPRLSVGDVLNLIVLPVRGVEDGLRRMELLGAHGICDWAGIAPPRRPP
jgi:hypothetical protein